MGNNRPAGCQNIAKIVLAILFTFYHNSNMKTNIEKVTEYMEQSPLNQVFVMQAIDMYAKQVSDDKEETIKQMEKSIIDGQAWVNCANDWEK